LSYGSGSINSATLYFHPQARECNVCSVKGFSLALQAPPGAAE
jgi:hypothetical protein